MNKFEIFNKSSERMAECQSDSVDLVITSPPYNIGTAYDQNDDNASFDDYQKMLENVFSECTRVLKPGGRMVVEAADSIFSKDGYIQLAALIVSIVTQNDCHLIGRDINFVNAENGIEAPDHGWDSNFVTREPAHSNCQHWLVFAKGQTDFAGTGGIYYLNYLQSEEHPCPFPDTICDFFLNKYFKSGNIVLDPFMGIAVLGAEVIKRGGFFSGYEIDSTTFNKALARLERSAEQ